MLTINQGYSYNWSIRTEQRLVLEWNSRMKMRINAFEVRTINITRADTAHSVACINAKR